jgi:addiction module HigA family antidote
MYNHPHPGTIIKDILIDGAKLSITGAATILGVNRVSVSKLINGHVGISPEMAVRLSVALNTSSDMWIKLQANYELWKVECDRKSIAKQVTPLKKPRKTTSRHKAA